MKWILLLLFDPKKAMDWCDARGHLDHGKVAADLVIFTLLIVTVIVAITTHQFPPIGLVIVLVAGAMGSRVFMAFLRSKAVTSVESLAISAGRPLTRAIDHPDVAESGRQGPADS